MIGEVAKPAIRERVERARHFFSERAARPARADQADFYEALHQLNEYVETVASLLEDEKIESEEIRHHLEEAGCVPHVRRSS